MAPIIFKSDLDLLNTVNEILTVKNFSLISDEFFQLLLPTFFWSSVRFFMEKKCNWIFPKASTFSVVEETTTTGNSELMTSFLSCDSDRFNRDRILPNE